MTSTGVGLVGAGRIAALHVAALREVDVPVVGVVSSNPQRSGEAAWRLGVDTAHDDLRSLLADPRIDTVHVTTPTALHADQVEEALRAGKHVVCEKPLATTSARAAGLVRLAAQSGLVGAVAYAYRFHPAVAELRDRVRGVGRPVLVRASYLQEWMLDAPAGEWRLDPARNGSSRVVADIGSHAIDVVQHVTGRSVRAVCATVRDAVSRREVDVAAGDDVAVIAFELDGGTIGSLQLAQVAAGHTNSLVLEVTGDSGSLAIDLRDATRLWRASRGHAATTVDLSGPSRAGRHGFSPTGTDADYVSAYAAFFRAVRRAVDGDGDGCVPTFADCLRTHLVRDAVLRSATERRWRNVESAGHPVDGFVGVRS